MGAATSSFQIEGALTADGRSPSIWDDFPVFGGHTGRQACDHYHRYRDDVALMKRLNLEAYRFSLSWSRIHPKSDKKLNTAGMDFYDRLVDELLAQEIEPWVTLFHWDLPVWMHEKGGWEDRSVIDYFQAYVEDTLQVLGDRVKKWFTLNEPWCSAIMGYQTGEHAPGFKLSQKRVLQIVHHHLLAHGKALESIRSLDESAQVGVVLNPWIPMPLTTSKQDIEAAEIAWQEHVGWWLEPLYRGEYPVSVVDVRKSDMPDIEPGDMKCIAQPCDFLGLNLYFPGFVRYKANLEPFPYEECGRWVNLPMTEMGWQVYPPVLSYALERIHRFYKPGPLYITENGCAMDDEMTPDGHVHDFWRKEYYRTHIDQLLSLRQNGVPVHGYFAWSLLDNFEWQHGYSKRFGLVYVDYETQVRTPKSSAHWYSNCIAKKKLYSV